MMPMLFGIRSVYIRLYMTSFYKELQQEGKVPIRVFLTVYAEELDNSGIPLAGTVDGLITCHRYRMSFFT